MNFNFNLSSDEDDDQDHFASETPKKQPVATLKEGEAVAFDGNDFDNDSDSDNEYDDYFDFDDDRKASSLDASSHAAMAFPSDFDLPTEERGDGEDDDDEDEIDWEDAEGEKATGRAIATPKAVTLDMGEGADAKKSPPSTGKKRKAQRSVSVFRHHKELAGNPALQQLLTDLHKASLLAWVSHSNCFSRYASDDTCLAVAHSLIPTAWLWNDKDQHQTSNSTTRTSSVVIPTADDVGHFVRWFVDYAGLLPSNEGASSSRWRRKHSGSRNRKSTRATSTKAKKDSNINDIEAVHTPGGSVGVTVRSIKTYRLFEHCRYLAKRNDDRQHSSNNPRQPGVDFGAGDALLLFLCMVRSLGWRARYVVALEPISRDLNVDHPLFRHNDETNDNVLARFFKRVIRNHGIPYGSNEDAPISVDSDESDSVKDLKPAAKQSDTPSAARKPSLQHQYPKSLFTNEADPVAASKHIGWVEILCRQQTNTHGNKRNKSDSTRSSRNMQWIHVDPIAGITNQPCVVEKTLFENHRLKSPGSIRRYKNRRPVCYALAVEHVPCRRNTNNSVDKDKGDLSVRMTDVTRRYASSMVETMEARGIVPDRRSSKPKRRKMMAVNQKQVFHQASIEEDRPDVWFSKLLEKISGKRMGKKSVQDIAASSKIEQQELKHKGKTEQDAITLDSDSDSDKKPAAIPSKSETVESNLNGLQNEDDHDDGFDTDHEEESQLRESAKKEPLPTSKAAFKKHPIYVIRSVLNSTEVLKPDCKKGVCGMFKGELVYLRSYVETALPAKRWLYEGRKVKASELKSPVLKVKARKKPASSSFKALKSYGVGEANDGSEEFRADQIEKGSAPLGETDKQYLYGSWQTDAWGPPYVGPSDPIPVNDYNNVELELLNPGLVHVELHHVAKVAKRLNLPYAPCLLGFEGHRGNRTPTIRGIAIHEHNEELLREAHAGMADHLLKEEEHKRERAILLRWKRLLVGILTKDRLEREYGDDDI
ncbi:unnamed protein product [Pseudo-nitzschia multistriata]|uniref:Rad4 beta-hairpin domain-containing protein n=1 Tax=Pseudo-nitzschia multistriata TaxID=183589 RepID=A0A448YUB4_9STRA|nr:unnamed protein product [Pseudo-nitzschia multistriata]